MPTKKKKPTLKNVQRGFATTSIASSKKLQEEQVAAAGAAAGEEAGEQESSTAENPNGTTATVTATAAGGSSASSSNRSGKAAAAANGTAAGAGAAAGRYGFDEEDAEQQELQNLVEKHMDRIEKDVARFWKVIEFDRRFASALPTFELDPEMRDAILELASYYTRGKLSGVFKASKASKKEGEAEEDDTQIELFPSLSASAATFSPRAPVSLSASAATFTPTTGPICPPEWSEIPAAPLQQSSEPLDKLLPKACVTRALLRKLGFDESQALMALRNAPNVTDVEECVAWLALRLTEDEVGQAWNGGGGAGKSSASTSRAGSGNATPKLEQSGEKEQEPERDEGEQQNDPSVPPQHDAYRFTRIVQARNDARAAFANGSSPDAAAAGGASGGQNEDGNAGEGSEGEEQEVTAEGKKRVLKPPPESLLLLPSAKLRDLQKWVQSVAQETQARLHDVDGDGSDLDLFAVGPIAAWVSTQLALRGVSRAYDLLRRAVGGGRHVSSPLGVAYETAQKLREVQKGLYARAVDAERVPRFNKATAENVLKESVKKEEAAAVAKKRKSLAENWEEAVAEAEKVRAKEVMAEKEEKRRKEQQLLDDAETSQPLTVEADGEKEGANGAESGKAVDEEPETMFGDLLEETPKQVTEVGSDQIIHLRKLSAQAKSGSSGKSPRSILQESLRRIDPQASVKYHIVGGGGSIKRARLVMRWSGPAAGTAQASASQMTAARRKAGAAGVGNNAGLVYVDTFELTGEGCETQAQADDMLASLALNCLEKDKPVQRLLPTGFREWWEEIETHRGRDKDAATRALFARVRDALLPRLTEAKKPAVATAATVAQDDSRQKDFKDMIIKQPRVLDERASNRLRDMFEAKTAAASYQKMLVGRKTLPIFAFRSHILDVVANSQVFVLSGETGCGKSTQVPAYIMEDCLRRGEHCRIYCTEPRRISAISLAERVSAELGESKNAVGTDESLVGYSIRLESNIGRNTRLAYVTNGILLRMLEGDAFNDVTHLIIDEVHERSIESDFLLIILKTLMSYRRDLKVVLMSATVDAERISAYFGGCPTVSVPGRTFPVNAHYLEDAVEMSGYILEDNSQYEKRVKRRRWNQDGYGQQHGDNVARLKANTEADDLDDSDEENGGPTTSFAAGEKLYTPKTIKTIDRMDHNVVNHELILHLLEQICFRNANLKPYSAATLVFMPGLAEIRACFDLLTAHNLFGNDSFRIYPLHSTISSENQSAVFDIPPPGVRKIVIATNIAETGITIPDITCVIDTGRQREMRYDEKRQISRLVDCFVSKSNAKQRRGRAGRVQEGICFHLFTKLRHDEYMDEHPLPEMLRLSLQDLALKLKVMKVRVGSSIEDALMQALDPPAAINIQRAVQSLVEVKALTTTEDITALGRHLSRLPLDVHMAKFLLIATTFRCLDAALTIAATLNSKSPFVTPFGKEAQADAAKLGFKIADSDFLTIANAFNSWRRAVTNNFGRQFCAKNFLSQQNLQQIQELRQQYLTYLLDSGFVVVDDETRRDIARSRFRSWGRPRFTQTPAEYNINGSSVAIINAAAACGLYPKLISIDPQNYSLKTLVNNQPVSVHPSSVNFRSKLSELPKGVHHLLYFTILQSRKLYAWDTAALDDKAILLVCGEADPKFSANSLFIDRRVKAVVQDLRSNVALNLLRDQVMRLITTAFRSPGKPWSEERAAFFDLAVRMLGAGNPSDLVLQQ